MTQSDPKATTINLAVDVMGADLGVARLLKGLERTSKKYPEVRFLLFGQQDAIQKPLRKYRHLSSVSEIHHADDIVSMEDKPSQVMRRGKNTSMYAAIQAVKSGDAQIAISCGNTGALMALSMLILRKAPHINRPAIAVLWPSRNPHGFNVMLDAGADIRAEAVDLMHYAAMGASYARNAFDLPRPRIGILNVGTEDGKGRGELSAAADMIEANKDEFEIEFSGFVEGADLVGDKVDVIVTDGFTGNVALKTGEGTARYISDHIKATFTHSLLSRIGALFAYGALRRLKKKMDPRRSNGGVFLGLGGTVIKSHGGSDHIAMDYAARLAIKLAEQDFHKKVNSRLDKALKTVQSSPHE